MDPISLAVIKGALEQITTEMDALLVRSAISPIIAETNDMANGIYHPITGETIAQGTLGLPVFLANMQFAVQAVINKVKQDVSLRPHDVYIMNDPYLGGTHLQDIQLVMPVFYNDRLFCFLANTGHMVDIGGATPGGWAPKAQVHFEEGLLIPPVKLYEEGRINKQLQEVILRNLRVPNEVAGDIEAMRDALLLGERRLIEVLDRFGKEQVTVCLDEMIKRSQQQMESYIEEIPDGIYDYIDYIDNDGLVDRPLKIAVKLTVSGNTITVDFSGTDGHCMGPMNLSYTTTISACHVAIKHIFPDIPINGGTFKPFKFIVPEDSFLYAKPPQAVSGYLEVVGRVIDVIFGALSQAIPNRVPAACFGTTGVMTIAGTHPETGKYFVGVFPYPGGYGASYQCDGLVHGNTPQSMANFVSLEASEHRYPIQFEYFRIREGSGGAGQYRGGCGTSYAIKSLSDDLVVSILGDRAKFRPFGVRGGGAGEKNEIKFHLKDGEMVPPMLTKIERHKLFAGEVVELNSPGGGGYGDPANRPREKVLEDLNRGYITEEQALKDYKVRVVRTRTFHGLERYEPEQNL